MDETTRMSQDIRKITLILTTIVTAISLVLFQGKMKTIGVGIVIGACCGIIGFQMIANLGNRLEEYDNARNKAIQSYTRRYAMYTLIFALSASVGVQIIALLVGMLCHKASIGIYVFLHRKED
ncbi:MAG: hypothetical protein RR602_02100 [Longicatena sp.]